ncbi:hypothetical protein SRHO_G00336370 [Serrasalmus rhombeus]
MSCYTCQLSANELQTSNRHRNRKQQPQVLHCYPLYDEASWKKKSGSSGVKGQRSRGAVCELSPHQQITLLQVMEDASMNITVRTREVVI